MIMPVRASDSLVIHFRINHTNNRLPWSKSQNEEGWDICEYRLPIEQRNLEDIFSDCSKFDEYGNLSFLFFIEGEKTILPVLDAAKSILTEVFPRENKFLFILPPASYHFDDAEGERLIQELSGRYSFESWRFVRYFKPGQAGLDNIDEFLEEGRF